MSGTDPKGPSRRAFLGLAAAAAALVAKRSFSRPPAPSEFASGRGYGLLEGLMPLRSEREGADRALERLPDKLPGAAAVVKLPVMGAKAAIAHILQYHRSSLPDEIGEPVPSYIFETQNEILRIYTALAQRGMMETLYIEGAQPAQSRGILTHLSENIDGMGENVAVMDRMLDDCLGTRDRMLRIGVPGTTIARIRRHCEDCNDARTEMNSLYKSWTQLSPYLTLQDSYDVEVICVDDDETQRRDLEARASLISALEEGGMLSGLRAGYQRSVMAEANDLREDRVIGNVARLMRQRQEELGFLTFGGGHCFSRAIARWNRRNPDHRISLVEIFPETYARRNPDLMERLTGAYPDDGEGRRY